jgi:hypothetical protein
MEVHVKYMNTPANMDIMDATVHFHYYVVHGLKYIPKSSAIISAAFSPMRSAVEYVFCGDS